MAARSLLAKQLWQILGNALKTKTVSSAVSVRRFHNFGLFKSIKISGEKSDSNVEWYEYEIKSDLHLFISHVSNRVTAVDLIGFNNTGNICVWPSEEVLAYYSLQNAEIFKGKNVCELGGGMTCLAGLVISVHSEAKEVLLTDGNEVSVQNLELIVKRNKEKFGTTLVTSRLLNWDESESLDEYRSKFDVILCADCLFFKEMIDSLIKTIYFLLQRDGIALILAPSRSGTLKNFCDNLDSKSIERIDFYNEHIWNLHNENKLNNPTYSEDLHYPLMIKMHKPEY